MITRRNAASSRPASSRSPVVAREADAPVEEILNDTPEIETPEVATETATESGPTFAELDLEPRLLKTLAHFKFVTPTPIQRDAIPVGLQGEDIIGIAQTGTGKTLAFGLPIIDRFIRNGNRSRGRTLVVLPTRELALQVEETFSKVGRPFGLKTAVLIGGAPMRPQMADLRANPDVIVVTPGRLIDHLQQRNVDLRTVDTLVLDEADRMLDMGFAPQIKQILSEVPSERQTMLFSATMPDQIVEIAAKYMKKPTRIEVARAGTAAEQVTQEVFIVGQDDKNELLSKVLYEYQGSVLIFARTRSRARRVARTLRNWDHSSAEIHSDRTLPQRREALEGFKHGKYRILVATDIAARGIDVTGIELVVNYDLPDNAEDYVHRIGRTGRAGLTGHAISFAAPDQASDFRDIERLIRTEIAISEHSRGEWEAIVGSGSGSRRRRPGGSSGGGGNRPSSRPSSSRPSSGNSAPRRDGEYRGGRSESGSASAPRDRGNFAPARPVRRGQRSFGNNSS